MKLELYYFKTCPYCKIVIDTINKLAIRDKITFKDIYSDYKIEDELVDLSGNKQVPTLVIDGKPMKESQDIKAFLLKTFS